MDAFRMVQGTDTSGSLVLNAAETLEEFTKRCWGQTAFGRRQVVWGMFEYDHIGGKEMQDLCHQIDLALGSMA
eukprot:1132509-Alexandrium_andersonii.AAC.1